MAFQKQLPWFANCLVTAGLSVAAGRCDQAAYRLSDYARISQTAMHFSDVPFFSCMLSKYSVSQKKSPLRFSDIFPKRIGIFKLIFTHLSYVPLYTRLQIFIQLSPTLTKLCHIKRDYMYLVHIICAKCPKRAKTSAFRRLRKSLIALLIVVCGKSL